MAIKVQQLKDESKADVAVYEITATSNDAEVSTGANPFGTVDVDVQFEAVSIPGQGRNPGVNAGWKVADVTDATIVIRKEAREGSGSDKPQVRMFVRASPEKVAARAEAALAPKPAAAPAAPVSAANVQAQIDAAVRDALGQLRAQQQQQIDAAVKAAIATPPPATGA